MASWNLVCFGRSFYQRGLSSQYFSVYPSGNHLTSSDCSVYRLGNSRFWNEIRTWSLLLFLSGRYKHSCSFQQPQEFAFSYVYYLLTLISVCAVFWHTWSLSLLRQR